MVLSFVKYLFLMQGVYAQCKDNMTGCAAPDVSDAIMMVQHQAARIQEQVQQNPESATESLAQVGGHNDTAAPALGSALLMEDEQLMHKRGQLMQDEVEIDSESEGDGKFGGKFKKQTYIDLKQEGEGKHGGKVGKGYSPPRRRYSPPRRRSASGGSPPRCPPRRRAPPRRRTGKGAPPRRRAPLELECGAGYYTRRRSTSCDFCSGETCRRRSQTCKSCPANHVAIGGADDCTAPSCTAALISPDHDGVQNMPYEVLEQMVDFAAPEAWQTNGVRNEILNSLSDYTTMSSSASNFSAEIGIHTSNQISYLALAAVATVHGSRGQKRNWAKPLEDQVNALPQHPDIWTWYAVATTELQSALRKLGMYVLSESYNFSHTAGGSSLFESQSQSESGRELQGEMQEDAGELVQLAPIRQDLKQEGEGKVGGKSGKGYSPPRRRYSPPRRRYSPPRRRNSAAPPRRRGKGGYTPPRRRSSSPPRRRSSNPPRRRGGKGGSPPRRRRRRAPPVRRRAPQFASDCFNVDRTDTTRDLTHTAGFLLMDAWQIKYQIFKWLVDYGPEKNGQNPFCEWKWFLYQRTFDKKLTVEGVVGLMNPTVRGWFEADEYEDYAKNVDMAFADLAELAKVIASFMDGLNSPNPSQNILEAQATAMQGGINAAIITFIETVSTLVDMDHDVAGMYYKSSAEINLIQSTIMATWLQNLGESGCTSANTCNACQGDCDYDSDCASGLICFQRNANNAKEDVPGCASGGDGDINQYDYCYAPQAPPLHNLGESGCTSANKCNACQGDCDYDSDCASGLICFQRNANNANEDVPGCASSGDGDINQYDYCYAPHALALDSYTHYPSKNCYSGSGAGEWFYAYPVGTGVEACKSYCNSLPYGDDANHCSLIVVRSNGQCYVKSGPADIAQCPDQGPTKDTYIRNPQATSHAFLGVGNCRDDSGRYIDQYWKRGSTASACETQCSNEVLCGFYDFRTSDGECAIYTRAATSAPAGWTNHPGNGATMITQGNGVAGTYCKMKKASTGIPSNGLVFSIRASESTASVITDSVAGLTIGGKSITTHEGHSCWNLDNDYLQRSGGSSLTEGQFYTHAVWVYWRASDSGWRTLMRPSQDHSILIQYGGKSLGMYSNRNGGWKDSGYDITSDMSGWQLVVVTGAGSSSTSSTGTSTFYTGVAGQSAMTHIGTADRVVSGTTWYRLGWGGQGPGKVAAAYEWNRVLSAAELDGLLQAGVEPGIPSQAVCLPDAYTSCPSLGCSVNWAPYCQTTCRYNGCVAAPTPAPTPAPTTPAPTTPAPTTPAPTPAPIPSNFACTLWKGRADNNFNGDPGSCVNWTNDTYLFTGCPYGALNWPADGSKSDVFINNLMAARPELDFSVSWRQKPLYCDRPWNCNGDCWWAGVGCSGTHTAANNCSALVSTLNNEYGTTFFCLGPLMGHYYLASKDCDGNLAVLNGPELTPATPLPPTPTASPPTAAPTGAPTFVGIGANCPSGYTKKTPNQANKHCGWSTRQCNGHAYPSTDIRRQQCPGNAYCVLGPTNGKLTMPNGTNINSIFVHRRRNANIGYTNCFDGCEIALDDNDYVTAAYGDIHSLCKEKCDAWSLWCVSYVVIPSNTEYRGQANKQPYCFLGSNCSSCSHWGNSKYTNPAGEEAFVCERNPTPLPTPPPTLAPISYSEHTVSSTFWDDGTTICSRVTTQEGCEKAAGGPLSGSGSWYNQPVGCIKTGGKYYLNTRSAGWAQSGTIIVCAQA